METAYLLAFPRTIGQKLVIAYSKIGELCDKVVFGSKFVNFSVNFLISSISLG